MFKPSFIILIPILTVTLAGGATYAAESDKLEPFKSVIAPRVSTRGAELWDLIYLTGMIYERATAPSGPEKRFELVVDQDDIDPEFEEPTTYTIDERNLPFSEVIKRIAEPEHVTYEVHEDGVRFFSRNTYDDQDYWREVRARARPPSPFHSGVVSNLCETVHTRIRLLYVEERSDNVHELTGGYPLRFIVGIRQTDWSVVTDRGKHRGIAETSLCGSVPFEVSIAPVESAPESSTGQLRDEWYVRELPSTSRLLRGSVTVKHAELWPGRIAPGHYKIEVRFAVKSTFDDGSEESCVVAESVQLVVTDPVTVQEDRACYIAWISSFFALYTLHDQPGMKEEFLRRYKELLELDRAVSLTTEDLRTIGNFSGIMELHDVAYAYLSTYIAEYAANPPDVPLGTRIGSSHIDDRFWDAVTMLRHISRRFGYPDPTLEMDLSPFVNREYTGEAPPPPPGREPAN